MSGNVLVSLTTPEIVKGGAIWFRKQFNQGQPSYNFMLCLCFIRSISTLAITTLLKIGNESSVDRLTKQITNFMSDIADEFKIVVVEAIRSLCLRFPLKYKSLMNFPSNILKEEGGFEYKKAIIDSIVILIRDIPEAKESGLLHLCEFNEDCEFTYLSMQIIHFLGNEGPKTSNLNKYIRYIYNQVHLENATVRASAGRFIEGPYGGQGKSPYVSGSSEAS